MSNIPHFNFKEFQDANIESANLKRERDRNDKIQQLRYERKKIEDLEKGIEEENQLEQMKKNEIRNEQLKDYSEFVRKKYDKSYQYLIKNQLPVKIGQENRKNLYYDYTQTNNSIEDYQNYNNEYNENTINSKHNRTYSQPNINVNTVTENDYLNNERYKRYNQYLGQVNLNNSYGKVYNTLENEKKYLKNTNHYYTQQNESSFNSSNNYYQNQNLNSNNIYDDYIRRNTPKPVYQESNKQYEYNNNPEKINYHEKILNEEKIQKNINLNNNNYNQIQTQSNNYDNNNYNQIQTQNNNYSNYYNLQNNEKNKPEFLDSRKEYLHNKKYNTSSIGNIITDPYTKKPPNELSDYKERIRNERHYKELLDNQIIYTNNNYRPLRRAYTNPNPYEVIREKNSPFYEVPHDPYNLKTYNFNVISSLPNNPITNPINSYRFRDKRKIYNEYFTNLGKILVKK